MDGSLKPEEEEEEEFVDSSSESVLSEGWQELSKSDYAKVIFCDLYHDAHNGGVGCKFQITDNVHEDPCDFVGLYKVGESQCIVSKLLSETECEEDGKLLRCVFTYEELPSDIQDGFYQFQYITRDKEVCGASTAFEIKQAQPKEDSSDDDIVTENAENDFVLVQHTLYKKNRMLEQLLEKFRAKNLALSSDMEVLLEAKSKLCQEKEEVIECLHQEILSLKAEYSRNASTITEKDSEIHNLAKQVQTSEQAAVKHQEELDRVAILLDNCQHEKLCLHKEVQMLKEVLKEREMLPSEPEQRILLEQLEDQKFMIRALEDSKQLALKEMSDLSESLSKRTKVLNQTRSELASCMGKLKESTSIIEKQNHEISSLNQEVKDLTRALEMREERLRKHFNFNNTAEMVLVPAAEEVQDSKHSEEDIRKLLTKSFDEAEKFLDLVDKVVEKIDFNNIFQEKAFYELKIMFFVLLGKMKKPNTSSSSKKSSSKKSHVKQDEPKKPASRMLPSCQGQASAEHSIVNNQKPEVDAAVLQNEDVTQSTQAVLASVDESTLASVASAKSSIQFSIHEVCEKGLSMLNEMSKTGIPNIRAEDLTFFNDLMESSQKRPKFLMEGPRCLEDYEADEPPNILLSSSIRGDMLKLENIFDAIREHLLISDDWAQVIEDASIDRLLFQTIDFFLDSYKKNLKIDMLLKYLEIMSENCEKDKLDYSEKERLLSIEVEKLKSHVKDILSELKEFKMSALKLNDEIAKKDTVIQFLSTEKINLIKNEFELQETVKEHTARIAEAGEIYKKQYLELEKLRKKLRHAQRHSSKLSSSKVVGYESSSTAEDMSQSKPSEKAPPTKRPRKTNAKTAEKMVSPKKADAATSSKAADKQPLMLKVLLKPYSKHAEKLVLKNGKKNAVLKTQEKLPSKTIALESTSAVDEKASQEKLVASASAASPDILLPANAAKLSPYAWPDMVKETISGGLAKKTSKTKKSLPLRSISDSDTGEHVLRNTSVLSTEGDKPLDAKQKPNAANLSPIKDAPEKKIVKMSGKAMASCKLSSAVSNKTAAHRESTNRDLLTVQKLFTEEIAKVNSSESSMKTDIDESFTIPCVLCNMPFSVTSLSNANLMDHLESEHDISMCPVCGQLFEASFPKKYIIFHVDSHFNSK